MKRIHFSHRLISFGLILSILLFGLSSPAQHRSYHSSGRLRSSYSHSTYSGTLSTHHSSTYSTTAPRDSHGRIKRSSKSREAFMKETGYPHGRPGYVIDHVKPLSEGGADQPSNMQWQTKQAAKEKDKWERGQKHKVKSRRH